MKNSLKKVLSFVLCAVMAFSVAVPAFAAEDDFAAYLGEVTSLTEGVSEENGIFANKEDIVLDYALASDISDSFTDAAWRVIVKLTVAESVTDGMLAKAKYYIKNADAWNEIGIVSESEFYNAESESIVLALKLSAEDLSKDELSVTYGFDWDGNGTEETLQQVKIVIDTDKVTLIHGENNINCVEYVDEPQVEPTCTQVGYTESSHCSVCGLTIQPRTEIKALGHDFSEKIVDDRHFSEENGDGTSTYFYNCVRENCDTVSTEDTYLVSESDYSIPAAAVTAITKGLEVDSENAADVTVSNTEMIVLDFAPMDLSIGRYMDGWWAGVKITADKSLTVDELKNVKYKSFGKNGWSEAKSFWSYKDSDDDAAEHFITVWIPVTPGIIANAADGILSLIYKFDWDNNGFGISTQKITINLDVSKDKISLMHTEGHTKVVTEAAVEPTCDTVGYTESSYCSVCGLTISEKTEIAALGHDFSEVILDDEHFAYEATCTHYDLYRYSCIRCDVMSSETFYEDKEGSVLKEHVKMTKLDDIHLISPADCENPAWYHMGCKNCDTVFYDEDFSSGSPIYHSWKIEKITKKATVNADGAINFYCVDCKKQDNSPIPIPRVASIKLSATTLSYTGKAITPSVTVKDRNGAELRKGTDYTVKYINADLPGTATARITFIGKYEGTYDAKYNVEIPVPAKTAFASNNSAIKISWDKVPVAAGYAVYVKNGSTWKKLGTTKNTSATFSKLPSGTKYTFAVKAGVLKDGKAYFTGSYKTIDTVTTSPGPAKVVAAQNTSAIKLTWSAVKGADGYAVLLKTQSGWKTLGLTRKTTATLTGLKAGTNYIYAVRSVNLTASGQKVGGGYIQITTATQPIKPVVSATTSNGNATIRWTAVQGASGYEVYYKSATSGGFVLIDTVSAGTTTLTDTGYTSGSKYAFAVRATKAVQGGYIYGTAGQVIVTMS